MAVDDGRSGSRCWTDGIVEVVAGSMRRKQEFVAEVSSLPIRVARNTEFHVLKGGDVAQDIACLRWMGVSRVTWRKPAAP